MAVVTAAMRFEDVREDLISLQERDRYKDKDLAVLLANGLSLREAALSLDMRLTLATAIAAAPTFLRLVERLRRDREASVYSEDPDQGLEAEARGNYYTLRQIRDSPSARDADRLKAALALHEARPSVRKQKLEEGAVRIVFEVGVMERLQEGLAKMQPSSQPAIEPEFTEVSADGQETSSDPQPT